MKIAIENGKLVGCISVLEKLQIKGLKSIHRTRLANILIENLKRVSKEEEQLKKDHSKKDEKGEAIVIDGKYDVEDMDALKEDMDKFLKETVVIEGGDSPVFLKSVKQSLEESEVEWVGKESYDYAYLYEAFENSENPKEENK
ncbi:DUF1617 family protein [Niallia circulans]|uniref:DUF1617 family protein n=1 Tax=Niallia circulans TaxID=1397 RepID=UPI0015619204|nr:DUF1617 family protein [Niallia circulans]NRG32899.1 DUF1617 family protein [Niallia circulans]